MSYLSELIATRELLGNLTMREVKGQYRRTVLGQLWSLINPIATMVVYSIVFGLIFRARPAAGDPSGLDIYPLWLMSGLLAWRYFAGVVNGGLGSLVSNAGLIKKVYFPRMHLPLSVALSTAVTWCVELAVLIVAIMIFGGSPLPWLPLLVVAMLLLAMFASGLSMILAIVNVYFRDTRHFLAILLQLWMYLTPIIYPVERVVEATEKAPWLNTIFNLNPMLHFVNVFRHLLYDNRFPDLTDSLWCLGTAVIVFGAGYLVFSRRERGLAELL